MPHAFQVVVPESLSTWAVLLGLILPIAAGWLANLATDGLKQLIPKLDAAPTVVKQILSVLIAVVVGWVNGRVGSALSGDVHEWTVEALSMVFTVLAQQGIFRWKTNANLARQGAATLEQQADGLAPRATTNTVHRDPVPTSDR